MLISSASIISMPLHILVTFIFKTCLFKAKKPLNSTMMVDSATSAPERARLEAALQLLYAESKFTEILAQVDACLPKDEAGNFIAEQERSDVVHDLLAFLAERMLEMVSVSCSGALLAPPRFDDQS